MDIIAHTYPYLHIISFLLIYLFTSLPFKKVLDTIHIEGKRET